MVGRFGGRALAIALAALIAAPFVPATPVRAAEDTTTTVDSSQNPSTYGESVTFTATVSAAGGTPTGSVQFTVDGLDLGTAVTLSGGTATSIGITTLAAGTHPVVAAYTSDDPVNYASGSGSLAGDQVVQKATQTITFGALADKTLTESPVTVSATASSSLVVSFTSNSLTVCTVSGTSVTLLTTGSCSISADQAGNADWDPAPTVTRTFTVTKAAQTITFPALGGKTLGDAPFVVSATATSGLPVSFASQTTLVCTTSGTHGATVTLVGAGTCTIRATQGGDATWNAATPVEQGFAIGTADQTISFGALGPKTYGDAPFGVTASSTSGLTVSFSSLTTGVCTVSGTTVTIIAAGSCTVRASQAGNANYNAAPNIDRTFSVAKKSAVVTADDVERPYGTADPVFTATITGLVGTDDPGLPACSTSLEPQKIVAEYPITCTQGGLSTANYTYTYVQGRLNVMRAPLTLTADDKTRQYGLPNPALTAAVTGFVLGETAATAGLTGAPSCSTAAVATTSVGSLPITCSAGTLTAENYAISTLVPGAFQITRALAAPAIIASVNPAAATVIVTFTASVSWPTGTPTGTVTFYEGAVALSGPLAISSGSVGLPLSWPEAGEHDITAVYSGDGANFGLVSSAPFRQVIGKSGVAVTVTANRPTWETNVPITFTATLAPTASGVTQAVSGTVEFRVDGALRATQPVVGTTAAYTTKLAAGSHSVVAEFTPDTPGAVVFNPGTSSPVAKTVIANTVAASGVGRSSPKVFPVRDDWKDTVTIRGTRLEKASVTIKIYSPRGKKIREKTYGASKGTYSYAWKGRSSGKVLPAGKYKIVQVLKDEYGAKAKSTSYVKVVTKRMSWYSKAITVSPGPRHYQVGSTDTASSLSAPSSKSTKPVVINNAASGLAWIAAGYQFTLPSASTYRSLSFRVRGSWTGTTAPKIGLVPWNGGGSVGWASMYFTTRARTAMGTSPSTWYRQTMTNLTGIRSGRSVRAAIDSFTGPSGWSAGPYRYSITAVKLVVKYGVLR